MKQRTEKLLEDTVEQGMNKGAAQRKRRVPLFSRMKRLWTGNQRAELMRGVNVQALDNADNGDEFENIIV